MMKSTASTLRRSMGIFSAVLALAARAHPAAAPQHPVVATSNISLMLSASGEQPALVEMNGPSGLSLTNHAEEELPRAVEVNGAVAAVHWHHKKELDVYEDTHRVVFVYESQTPHLRLRWEWQARAN